MITLEHFRGLPPPLTPKEEKALGRRVKHSSKARHALLLPNIRLAAHIAKGYTGLGVSDEDLLSEAIIGVDTATKKFDPDRGKFSVCAKFYIRGAIRKHVSDVGYGLKKPVWYVDEMSKVRKIVNELTGRLGREPTDREVAQETGISIRRVVEFRKGFIQIVSMEDESLDGDSNRHDTVADPAALPSHKIEESDSRKIAFEFLQQLKPRYREVVERRFGIGREPQTLEQVATDFKITRERVRQIEELAIAEMRDGIHKLDPMFYGDRTAPMPKPEHRRTCGCGRIIINGDQCRECFPVLKLPVKRKPSRLRRAA